MLIGALGDFHGDHKLPAFEQFMAEARPDVLIEVGDLQYYAPMPVPFVWCRGNHEDWDTIAAIERGIDVPANHVYLADGERTTLGGLSIRSIGGNWSPTGKQAPKYIRHDYLGRMRSAHADIILSHETPIRYVNPAKRELTLEPLRELVAHIAPRFWFSGHHHWFETEQLGRTTIVSLGKWPHEWALLDSETLELTRFVPHDSEAYWAAFPAWREAEEAQKRILLAAERSDRKKRR